MNLWEINDQIQQAMDNLVDVETGEINEEAQAELDALEMQRDEKIENTALYIKNMKAYSAALASEIASLQSRKKTIERRIAGSQGYLARFLDGQRFSSPKAAVSFRKSEVVNVSDVFQIPEEYLRYKDPEPDKTAIKKALKAGTVIPGATIEQNVSIIIK